MIRDGRQKHPLYQTWRGMLKRCKCPTATGFHNYGGRGIKVCERWHDFWAFVNDVGPKPYSHSQLERKDNNGSYTPSNVHWASSNEQTRNTRYNLHLTVGAETKTMADWAKDKKIPKSTLFNRLKRGWSPERAITSPIANKAANGSVVPSSISVAAQKLGIKIQTLHSRIRRGWTIGSALNTPVRKAYGGNHGATTTNR